MPHFTDLADAIIYGTAEDVAFLLAQKKDVNEPDRYGFTPLIEAAVMNKSEIAELLLKQGAKINEPDMAGNTALHWAVENQNIKFCRTLINQGANVNAYMKCGQPVLFKPLLRQQAELKHLLLSHGANQKFAQDYINTKLLGHRFELKGRAYILDPENKFIEIRYEGFILEFTLAIIASSLKQFKNNFAAREFRDYFKSLAEIIESYENAMDLMRYQHYQIKIENYSQQIDSLLKKPLLLLPVAYEGHAITFIKYKNFLVLCDRGERSKTFPSVSIYQMQTPQHFTPAVIKQLIYQRQNKLNINEKLLELVAAKLVAAVPLPSQLIGNCSWANVEAAFPAMLWLLMQDQPTFHHQDASQIAMDLFHEWQEWDHDFALQQCIDAIQDASAARKASKIEILAAILFQTSEDDNPHHRARIAKILPILNDPDYRYILDSYKKVYLSMRHLTPQAKRLMQILDIYQK